MEVNAIEVIPLLLKFKIFKFKMRVMCLVWRILYDRFNEFRATSY